MSRMIKSAEVLHWMPIRLKPDSSTGELINVGICIVDTEKKTHIRLASHLKELLPIYGNRESFDLDEIYAIFEELEELSSKGGYEEIYSFCKEHCNVVLGESAVARSSDLNALMQLKMQKMVPLSSKEEPATPFFQIFSNGVLQQQSQALGIFSHYHQEIQEILGYTAQAMIWPYRVGEASWWAVDLYGQDAVATLRISVFVSGSNRLPHSILADPIIEVVDDIDAFYVTQALASGEFITIQDSFARLNQ